MVRLDRRFVVELDSCCRFWFTRKKETFGVHVETNHLHIPATRQFIQIQRLRFRVYVSDEQLKAVS